MHHPHCTTIVVITVEWVELLIFNPDKFTSVVNSVVATATKSFKNDLQQEVLEMVLQQKDGVDSGQINQYLRNLKENITVKIILEQILPLRYLKLLMSIMVKV